MSYIGDFLADQTFDMKFTTVTTTGAPTTLAGSPVISVYADNSVTQITAGITLTVDFDGVTGLNNVHIVATVANGYSSGSNYQIVITTGTVGGTSVVGYVVGQFSILLRTIGELPSSIIAASNFAAGAIDANAIASNAITSAKIAAGAITATGIATGAIDADALASDAVDEIWAKAASEPASVPAVTATAIQVLSWILALSRNKITQTSTTQLLRNDADSATIATSTLSDDGVTATRGEFA